MITTLYAAILAIVYIALTFMVARGRWKYKIGLGHGDNPEMERLIRIHANFAEYVPFALLLLFMLDISRFSPMFLHVLGIMLVVGRIAHAIGLKKSKYFTPWRGLGIGLTLLVILISAVLLIWIYVVIRTAGL